MKITSVMGLTLKRFNKVKVKINGEDLSTTVRWLLIHSYKEIFVTFKNRYPELFNL